MSPFLVHKVVTNNTVSITCLYNVMDAVNQLSSWKTLKILKTYEKAVYICIANL